MLCLNNDIHSYSKSPLPAHTREIARLVMGCIDFNMIKISTGDRICVRVILFCRAVHLPAGDKGPQCQPHRVTLDEHQEVLASDFPLFLYIFDKHLLLQAKIIGSFDQL